MEKHDEEFLRIGSTEYVSKEDLYKKIQDAKNSFESSQLTKDEYQTKLDSIHKAECLFQLYQLLNYNVVEKLGFEDMIDRIIEAVKLLNDFKAKGIDVGIDLAEWEEVLKSAAHDPYKQELLNKLDKFNSKYQHSPSHKQPSITMEEPSNIKRELMDIPYHELLHPEIRGEFRIGKATNEKIRVAVNAENVVGENLDEKVAENVTVVVGCCVVGCYAQLSDVKGGGNEYSIPSIARK